MADQFSKIYFTSQKVFHLWLSFEATLNQVALEVFFPERS